MGSLLKWLINLWIRGSGRKLRYADHPWLRGPMGEAMLIGDNFFQAYAEQSGLLVERDPDGGLVGDFLAGIPADDPYRERLLPEVAAFYEHTAHYKLEVWSQWFPPFALFGKTLIRALSTKMNQLNIPLEPLETSRGMSNEVIHLKDPATGELKFTCWLRKSLRSGKVVYSGFYSTVRIDGRPMVRVIFPLPGGNATVLLRVETQADGAVKLISDGNKIGDPGYYRVQRSGDDAVRLKYVPIKEVIHVYKDEASILRTDHIFSFFGRKMLELHYKILAV
jgi:hypothetical protein